MPKNLLDDRGVFYAGDDLDRAFKKDDNGFWVVRFIENDTPMVIDASTARKNQGLILKKYQIPTETQENEKQYLF